MLLKITEPARPPRRGFALFALGFRPFYLCAAACALAAIGLWMRFLETGQWSGVLPAAAWHPHEMIYGLALAAIAGFLLTAGRVWTGLDTPTGWPLGLLAGHWVLARVFLFAGPSWLGVALDTTFPFVLALVMGRLVIKARSVRNYFAPLLLVALGAVNLGFHAGQAGLAAWESGTAIRAALYLVMTMVMIIGGRVVPAFTANALPRAGVKVVPGLERAVLICSLSAFALDFAGPLPEAPLAMFAAMLATVAAVLQLWRQWLWRPHATLGTPLLWVLHAAHAWIPVGLLLLACAALDWVPRAAALHAFGVGAMGGMILGMITRTALGHTGRPLRAAWPETSAYLFVHLAACSRLLAFLPGASGVDWLSVAAHLWMAAFALYLVAYTPRLLKPRLDGRPG